MTTKWEKIKDASEEEFLEATASTFDVISERFKRIKEDIAMGDYAGAEKSCRALAHAAAKCAEVVRERAS